MGVAEAGAHDLFVVFDSHERGSNGDALGAKAQAQAGQKSRG